MTACPPGQRAWHRPRRGQGHSPAGGLRPAVPPAAGGADQQRPGSRPDNTPTDQDPPNSRLQFQGIAVDRSEEHTSELQSPCNLVCRLLLEKKKKKIVFKNNIKDKQHTLSLIH